MAILHVVSILFTLAAIVCAQPQSEPARTTRAVTLIGNDIYLYGGSGSSGTCFSDLYTLHLDPANGWVSGTAPWTNIGLEGSPTLAVGENSWAVGSTDGSKILVYGQTLCQQQLSKDPASPHPYNASSGSIELGLENKQWKPLSTEMDVLGPRQVKNDEPIPVQVIDNQNHIVYTFVYDAFNPQLGMQLWSFPADNPPLNIAQSAKNTTMPTTQPPRLPPPPATNGTNGTTEQVPPPSSTQQAPFVDVGAAVYQNGSIIVIGGGRTIGANLTGEDMDGDTGYYKMDRCWTYTIASNEWSVRTLTAQGGKFPLPRRLAALLVVDNKIYMHGGNTTQTNSTDTYAKDLWILDTQTWEWTAGPESQSGRALHTLIHFDNSLLSISGFEFETSKSKAAQNGFIMVYDMGSRSWGPQFGTITESYFQKHAVAIIGGAVAGFIALLVIASVASRLWRKYTRKNPSGATGITSKMRPNKPFLATASTARRIPMATTSASHPVAATRFSGMTLNNQNPGLKAHETQIDLSALPRTSDSTAYDLPSNNQQLPSQYQHAHQQQYNPYAPTQQQQKVPLMSANALEQQDDEPEPYADDEPEEEGSRPQFQSPPGGVRPDFP